MEKSIESEPNIADWKFRDLQLLYTRSRMHVDLSEAKTRASRQDSHLSRDPAGVKRFSGASINPVTAALSVCQYDFAGETQHRLKGRPKKNESLWRSSYKPMFLPPSKGKIRLYRSCSV